MIQTVLPDGQHRTVACTVLSQLCGPKANEMEMAVVLYPPKMVSEGTLTFLIRGGLLRTISSAMLLIRKI